jgi:hypothetical protein
MPVRARRLYTECHVTDADQETLTGPPLRRMCYECGGTRSPPLIPASCHCLSGPVEHAGPLPYWQRQKLYV